MSLREQWVAGKWDVLTPALLATATKAVQSMTTLSRDESEEIAQTVIVKFWFLKRIPDDPEAYAVSSARNAVRDLMKREQRNHARAIRLRKEDFDSLVDSSADLEEAMHDRELSRTVLDAVENLPDNYRLPVRLFHIEGNSIEETSRQCAINEGTCKMRLLRGRALLAKQLATPSDKSAFKVSLHAKLRGTVEIRAFIWLSHNQWHRIGTWNCPDYVWSRMLQPMLERGAAAAGIRLLIDDEHAVRAA